MSFIALVALVAFMASIAFIAFSRSFSRRRVIFATTANLRSVVVPARSTIAVIVCLWAACSNMMTERWSDGRTAQTKMV